MSIDAVSSSYSIFTEHLYTINVNGSPYDSTAAYGTDAVYTISMNFSSEEVPLALLYAALQIGLSDIASCQAESYMEKIEKNQEIQTAASNAIAEANTALDTITADTTGAITTATVSQELYDYCVAAGVTTTITVGATLTEDDLNTLIEDLELIQENAISTTQTDMVYAEEYLGQYNSYLTGSSTTLDDFSSSIFSIAGRIG